MLTEAQNGLGFEGASGATEDRTVTDEAFLTFANKFHAECLAVGGGGLQSIYAECARIDQEVARYQRGQLQDSALCDIEVIDHLPEMTTGLEAVDAQFLDFAATYQRAVDDTALRCPEFMSAVSSPAWLEQAHKDEQNVRQLLDISRISEQRLRTPEFDRLVADAKGAVALNARLGDFLRRILSTTLLSRVIVTRRPRSQPSRITSLLSPVVVVKQVWRFVADSLASLGMKCGSSPYFSAAP
jgi:hypothetical protein